jgi:hypothetical protein
LPVARATQHPRMAIGEHWNVVDLMGLMQQPGAVAS